MQRRFKTSQGSIILVLYAAIAMIGVLAATSISVLKGPVKTMADVTRRTVAENAVIGSAKLALMSASRSPGDCDSDGMLEPPEWLSPSSGQPVPGDGGLLPPNLGAALKDPWGSAYGYCAWDPGSIRKNVSCGANARRLEGGTAPDNPVIAVLSAGPDREFQTACRNAGSGEYITRTPGSDDVILSYSFAEAMANSGGLWNLKDNDSGTAMIGKNLSVLDQSGQEQLSFNAASKDLSLGTGGTGTLPNIKTDYIQNLTANAPIEFLANLSATGSLTVQGETQLDKVAAENALISTSAANAAAAIVTASGVSGVGLKASGEKAVEADGLIDMTMHRIVRLAAPLDPDDAATKKYIDDKFASTTGVQTIRCESFVFTGCSGTATRSLAKTNLGACKKACEAAGVQCCEVEFASLPANPNAALSNCRGYDAPSQTNGSLRNILAALLGGGKFVAALCYLE